VWSIPSERYVLTVTFLVDVYYGKNIGVRSLGIVLFRIHDDVSNISASCRSLSFTSLIQTKMPGTQPNHVQAEFSWVSANGCRWNSDLQTQLEI